MGLKCGIVGLPNVGKSTLFNALTASTQAMAADYPFCTIAPNRGVIPIPDSRLEQLSQLVKAARTIPETLDVIDIAGLVKGAAQGEGLGNQFLGHIREVHAIIHVVRCFATGSDDRAPDPISDIQTVETELQLADLASVEKILRNKTKTTAQQRDTAQYLYDLLAEGVPLRDRILDLGPLSSEWNLLSTKPVVFACNVSEQDSGGGNDASALVTGYAQEQGAGAVVISAAIEAEISLLQDSQERAAFEATLGLQESGLNRLIRESFALLGLHVFYTAGPKEARAWSIKQGTTAPQAAGVIHTDFERGFIRAEVTPFAQFLACGGESAARQQGKVRSEGKDYVVQDGDVCHFLFNV